MTENELIQILPKMFKEALKLYNFFDCWQGKPPKFYPQEIDAMPGQEVLELLCTYSPYFKTFCVKYDSFQPEMTDAPSLN